MTGTKLRNIGPKSAAWLRQVGLRTQEDLESVGAVEAFIRVKRAGFRPSLNLLYALEGALLDCHWQQLPEARRGELLVAYDAPAARPPGRRTGDHDPHRAGRGRRSLAEPVRLARRRLTPASIANLCRSAPWARCLSRSTRRRNIASRPASATGHSGQKHRGHGPLLQWISCQEMPLGHDGRTLPVYCARFQVTRASCRVETGSR